MTAACIQIIGIFGTKVHIMVVYKAVNKSGVQNGAGKMPRVYDSSFVRRLNHRNGKPWQGVIKYKVDNPDYVEDTRLPHQTRQTIGRGENKKPNPDYIEDTRTESQKRRYLWKSVSKVFDVETVRTKTKANEALIEWMEGEERKAQASDVRVPVADFIDNYITTHEALGRNGRPLEPSTVATYRTSQKHIARLGGVLVCNLTKKQVESWMKNLTESGLGASSVTKAFRLLKMACEEAVEDDKLEKNPCRGLKPPSLTEARRKGAKAREALDAESLGLLMVALRERIERGGYQAFPVAVEMAVRLGMRRGEICALRWRDVDLDNSVITVSSTIGEANGKFYFKDAPKTDSSYRTVRFDRDDEMVAILRGRRNLMLEQLKADGIEIDSKAKREQFANLFVVGEIKDGKFYNPTTFTRAWKSLAEQLSLTDVRGMQPLLHAARYTFATLSKNGTDITNVSAALGHASINTTLSMYVSPTEQGKSEAQGVMADKLKELEEAVKQNHQG